MRTTLDIEDDVLNAAKDRARREKKTVGLVISELARQALTEFPAGKVLQSPKAVYGVRPFEKRGGLVTNELVDRLRDEDAY
jgi:hypothetical protein